jgi:hypothetical protein
MGVLMGYQLSGLSGRRACLRETRGPSDLYCMHDVYSPSYQYQWLLDLPSRTSTDWLVVTEMQPIHNTYDTPVVFT